MLMPRSCYQMQQPLASARATKKARTLPTRGGTLKLGKEQVPD